MSRDTLMDFATEWKLTKILTRSKKITRPNGEEAITHPQNFSHCQNHLYLSLSHKPALSPSQICKISIFLPKSSICLPHFQPLNNYIILINSSQQGRYNHFRSWTNSWIIPYKIPTSFTTLHKIANEHFRRLIFSTGRKVEAYSIIPIKPYLPLGT